MLTNVIKPKSYSKETILAVQVEYCNVRFTLCLQPTRRPSFPNQLKVGT